MLLASSISTTVGPLALASLAISSGEASICLVGRPNAMPSTLVPMTDPPLDALTLSTWMFTWSLGLVAPFSWTEIFLDDVTMPSMVTVPAPPDECLTSGQGLDALAANICLAISSGDISASDLTSSVRAIFAESSAEGSESSSTTLRLDEAFDAGGMFYLFFWDSCVRTPAPVRLGSFRREGGCVGRTLVIFVVTSCRDFLQMHRRGKWWSASITGAVLAAANFLAARHRRQSCRLHNLEIAIIPYLGVIARDRN